MIQKTAKAMHSILTHEPSIVEAMRQSHREAIRQHRMVNLPMVVWRDGAIVWIPPDQLPDIEEPIHEQGVRSGVGESTAPIS